MTWRRGGIGPTVVMNLRGSLSPLVTIFLFHHHTMIIYSYVYIYKDNMRGNELKIWSVTIPIHPLDVVRGSKKLRRIATMQKRRKT